MQAKEFRELAEKELVAQLVEFKKELMSLRFMQASKTLSNVAQVKITKKNIARINTVLVEKRNTALQVS